MTQIEFMTRLQEQWKPLSAEKIRTYDSRLRKFNHEERRRIFDYLVDEYTKQGTPQVADIMNAAKELAILHTGPRGLHSRPKHRWDPTDCELCHGEGRLRAWFEQYWERNRSGPKKAERFLCVVAFSDPDPDESDVRGAHSISYRCSCPAGSAKTVPNWPVWEGKELSQDSSQDSNSEPTLDPPDKEIEEAQDFLKGLGVDEPRRDPPKFEATDEDIPF